MAVPPPPLPLALRAIAALMQVMRHTPFSLQLLVLLCASLGSWAVLYLLLYLAAPIPRAPLPSEKQYRSVYPTPDGAIASTDDDDDDDDGGRSRFAVATHPLPCWRDTWTAQREASRRAGHALHPWQPTHGLEPAEVQLTVVVPAFNEALRLGAMLAEAVDVLERGEWAAATAAAERAPERKEGGGMMNGSARGRNTTTAAAAASWEMLIISDGSTDGTEEVALRFAARRRPTTGSIRVVALERQRGKGGAVTHGMRHARGAYVLFADADGASRFADVGKLLLAAATAASLDTHTHGRAVAIGSRAHLVGSDAVVKRSFLRNLLMHSFHLLLRLLTPPATAAVGDTQCGFKLFTRAALPFIVPDMHAEGWIFDVEMLMLAEAAAIPVVEVPVEWQEVGGSKLHVLWDSVGMACALALLRAAWALGVYRRGGRER